MSRVLLFFGLLPACIVVAQPNTDQDVVTVDGDVSEVSFDLGAGDLTVRVSDVEKTEVHRTFHWSGDEPDALIALDTGVLYLDVDCGHRTFSTCSVDHEVWVPAGVDVYGITGAGDVTLIDLGKSVDIETGAGDVDIDSATDVTASTGSGDVDLVGITGQLTLDTGAGDVVAKQLEGENGVVSTGSGDVTLSWIASPRSVDIDTGAGDVDLGVPAGSYDIDVDTGWGDVEIDGVTSDASAAATIYVSSGAGSVSIHGVD